MIETLAALLHDTLPRHSWPRLTRQVCPGARGHMDQAEALAARGVRVGDEGLREAARAVVDGWHDYIEALAGRGHEGPHIAESVLEGGCGPCEGARYGTEVAMSEYVVPALRAALAATPTPPEIDVERLARALDRVEEAGVRRGDFDRLTSWSSEHLAAAIADAYRAES